MVLLLVFLFGGITLALFKDLYFFTLFHFSVCLSKIDEANFNAHIYYCDNLPKVINLLTSFFGVIPILLYYFISQVLISCKYQHW